MFQFTQGILQNLLECRNELAKMGKVIDVLIEPTLRRAKDNLKRHASLPESDKWAQIKEKVPNKIKIKKIVSVA